MCIKILSFGSILLFTLSVAYANPQSCRFGKETVPNVICLGPAKLNETTVNGEVTVAGPIVAQNTIMLASMNVAGVADIKDASVKSNVTIAGKLVSKHGDFEGNLLINSDYAVFNASNVVGTVTVEPGETEKGTPVLKLICGSEVSGDIIFKGKPGVVKKSADSNVGGKIENGKLEEVREVQQCK